MKILDNEKTYKFLMFISVAVFAVSICAKFSLCSSITVKNGLLKDLFAQRVELEKEVSRLNYIDSSMSSLSYVENRAKALGFVEMNSRLLSLDPQAPMQIASITR